MKGRIKGGIWETINFSTGGHQPITSSLIAAEAASPNTGGEAIKLISRVVHGPSWYMDGTWWYMVCTWVQWVPGPSWPDLIHKWPRLIAVVYPEHFLFSLLNTLSVYLFVHSLNVYSCCSVPVRCLLSAQWVLQRDFKKGFCQEMQIFFVDYCIFCPLRQHKGLKQCSGQILLSLGILQGNDKKVKLT